MIDWLQALPPILQALLAACFTWAMTAVGAAAVLGTRGISQKTLDLMLGFAGGVMIAASFWSLLMPAIELSRGGELPLWLPPVTGFLLGGAFLRAADAILPHLHLGYPAEEAEGIRTKWQRSILLVLAITLHNIPEGLALGVAFGAAGMGLPSASFAAAIALAIGLGIQNFPEGLAVSAPLRREGMSSAKSFWYGQLSGAVEPLAAVAGAAVVSLVQPLLPYALSFAAGAMIFVVVEEVVPESQRSGNADLATSGGMAGFAVMMLLDIGLG
ncbi:MAG: ZIP family metal transporter [Chloroflexi bacterium]|nr:ZIP family metal transporter [Chloroflexota bacterium]